MIRVGLEENGPKEPAIILERALTIANLFSIRSQRGQPMLFQNRCAIDLPTDADSTASRKHGSPAARSEIPVLTRMQPKGNAMLLKRTSVLKILFSVSLGAGLAALPLSLKAQESTKPPAQTGQPAAKAKSSSTVSNAPETSTPRREPTEAQLAARERRVKCGAEWRAAKDKGAVEEGATWPKYWSACNKRLKEQGA
jgi:hypothetical protein